MKYLKLLVPALLLTLLVTSCKKDPELGETTFTLTVHPKVGTEDLVLGQEYLDQENYRIEASLFRFYLSHVMLTSANGDVEIADLKLLDMGYAQADKPLTFTVTAPAGSYTGIKFSVGLDSTQNSSNPSDFEEDSPLSLYKGTYWTWNTGYRFVMLEGSFDTIQNTPGPVSSTNTFAYHTGTAPLYSGAVLGNASTSFSIAEGENYTYNLDLDINKLFYGDQTIDRKQGAVTHTTSNYVLAQKFTHNFVRSFSLSAP